MDNQYPEVDRSFVRVFAAFCGILAAWIAFSDKLPSRRSATARKRTAKFYENLVSFIEKRILDGVLSISVSCYLTLIDNTSKEIIRNGIIFRRNSTGGYGNLSPNKTGHYAQLSFSILFILVLIWTLNKLIAQSTLLSADLYLQYPELLSNAEGEEILLPLDLPILFLAPVTIVLLVLIYSLTKQVTTLFVGVLGSSHRRLWRNIPCLHITPSIISGSTILTLSSFVVGKALSPLALAPHSMQMFVSNAVFDLSTVLLTYWAWRPLKVDSGQPSLRLARLVLVPIGFASIFSCSALYFGLVGTANQLSPIEVARTFVGLPYSPTLERRSTPIIYEIFDEIVESYEAGKMTGQELYAAAIFQYSVLDDSTLLDYVIEKNPNLHQAKKFKYSIIRINSTRNASLGPYFWVMHTTFIPFMVVLSIIVFGLWARLLSEPARWLSARARLLESPHELVALFLAAVGATFVMLQYIISIVLKFLS